MFLGMLSATLSDSLLGNILAGKRVARGNDGVIWAGEEIIKSGEGQDF